MGHVEKALGIEWLGRQVGPRNKHWCTESNGSHEHVERIIWALRRVHGSRNMVHNKNCWMWLPQRHGPLLVRQEKDLDNIFKIVWIVTFFIPFLAGFKASNQLASC